MTHIEYKENYTKSTLNELYRNMKQLASLYERDNQYKDKLEQIKLDMVELKLAIDNYDKVEPYQVRDTKIDVVMNDIQLTEDEKQLIEAFKTTALGREGLLNDAFFSGPGRTALKSLMMKGIVEEIPHFHHFSYLPNHTHYGLVGEVYPKTDSEWQGFRDSGYSEKMSFREYLEELKSGNIEWTADKINKFLDTEVSKVFNTKFKTNTYWVNFINFTDGLVRARQLVRENKSAEEVLKQTMIEYIKPDRFDDEIEVLDNEWYASVINGALEHLNGLKNAKR